MGNNKNLRVILAAGGTGGHIFPAEALSKKLIEYQHTPILVTDKRQKNYNSNDDNLEVHVIKSASPGSGILKKIIAIPLIIIGILQAIILLKKLKPNVVVGFGGYPSFPTMVGARILGIRSIIHEQNSVMGRVNRILAPYVDKIATSFEYVKNIKLKDRKKIILTGNPVRSAIKAVREIPYPELKENEHIHILVTGGSQGASIFSQIIPQAIIDLPDNIKKRVRIDQQCRAEDIDKVKKIYEDARVNADLATFFHDMPARIAAAHVLICRSGASTIAENTVTGRPAIYVPYLYAMDDHQTENAKTLADNKAGIIVTQNLLKPEVIAGYIADFIGNPEILIQIALQAFEMGIIDVEERLITIIESIAQ